AVGRAPVVLGAEDLRFTLPEVASLFPAVDGRRRSEAWQAVEGWPIGVVSLIRTGAEARPGPAGADDESISAYLSAEVLSALDEDLSSFLLEIAALDEFSVSLCNAVTGRDDAADALGRLRQHGLFLVETSGESDLDTGWYRLHHGVATELRRLARGHLDTDRVLRRAA